MTADRKLLRGPNVVPGRDELKRLVAEAMQQDSRFNDILHVMAPVPAIPVPGTAKPPSPVITGLVPVIPMREAPRLTASGWPGRARP